MNREVQILGYLSPTKKHTSERVISPDAGQAGKIVKRSLKPYTMCLHTNAAGGRENMLVLIAEEYESDIETGTDGVRESHSEEV